MSPSSTAGEHGSTGNDDAPSGAGTHAAGSAERYWGYIEQVGLGAFVAALVILAGLGIARGLGAHASGTWILEATALISLGLIVLILSVGRRLRSGDLRRRTRPTAVVSPPGTPGPELVPESQPTPQPTPQPAPQPEPAPVDEPAPEPPVVTWVCHADASTPGALLFVLSPTSESEQAVPASSRELGLVSCYVLDPNGVGQRADDDRISRARGIFTTRWHPSFFVGAPEPISGIYQYRWDEWRGEDWHLLSSGELSVDYRPLPGTELGLTSAEIP